MYAHRCCQGMRSCRVLRSSMRKPHACMGMTEGSVLSSIEICPLWVPGLHEQWHRLKRLETGTETSHQDDWTFHGLKRMK